MKRRKSSALPISLMALLMTTTVAYAGIAGQPEPKKQETLSTQIVTDKDIATGTGSASETAGISVCLADSRMGGSFAAGLKAADFDTKQNADMAKAPKAEVEQPHKEKEEEWEGRVIASNVQEYVYVRDEASSEGDVVGKLPRGGAGDVLEKGEDWTLISSGSVEGYVSNEYLAFDKEALQVAEEVCNYVATVEIDNASIRKEADDEAEVLSTASTGDVLEVVESTEEWVKVVTAECVGYMSGNIVNVELAVGEAVPVEPEEPEEPEETKEPAETADEEETAKPAETEQASESADTSAKEEAPAKETPAVESQQASGAATSNSATFKVTAYCSCSKCCGSYANGITATGTTVTAGRTIAVDKNVIPLGTTVYIDGVPYVAEDTGVSGNWIDLYMGSHEAALQWGVKYCTVTW